MNALAVLLALALVAPPARCADPQPVLLARSFPHDGPSAIQSSEPHDRWLAQDKLQHAFASLGAVTLTHAAARTVGLDGTPAIALGAAVSAAAGLGKEFYDRRHGRPFSVRDLVWDALGLGLGVLLVAQTHE